MPRFHVAGHTVCSGQSIAVWYDNSSGFGQFQHYYCFHLGGIAWVAGDEEVDDVKWGAKNGVCGPRFAIENNSARVLSLIGRFASLIQIAGRFQYALD